MQVELKLLCPCLRGYNKWIVHSVCEWEFIALAVETYIGLRE